MFWEQIVPSNSAFVCVLKTTVRFGKSSFHLTHIQTAQKKHIGQENFGLKDNKT